MSGVAPAALLELLGERRSTRAFTDVPIADTVLDRLLAAAVTAPSSSNRQPWRFVVVRSADRRRAVVDAVRRAAERLHEIIARSPHADEFGRYGDQFWQPLDGAAAIIVPCARAMPDTLAALVRSAGADPATIQLPSGMPMEVCATSAAVMALLVQAHAEGLGACWMAGPMIAAREVEALIELHPAGAPPGPHAYRMLGAIAVGHPAPAPDATAPSRKPIEHVVRYL
jgi:nitroreductase